MDSPSDDEAAGDVLVGASNNEGSGKVEYVTVATGSRPQLPSTSSSSNNEFGGPSMVRPPASPFNTSSSGKGSIASSSNLGSSSTFKSTTNGGECKGRDELESILLQ